MRSGRSRISLKKAKKATILRHVQDGGFVFSVNFYCSFQ
ncbi:hypothetical protein ELI_0431 [Eubacterium callanderi]|uniref:Uncharacterized protein n=1 Tax=Eubacterium callanderi TaxID=53442 RepID=E3GIG3_9FIRM|nr:hypothetical protein ELI_0431 [Eubacterium callanderi]